MFKVKLALVLSAFALGHGSPDAPAIACYPTHGITVRAPYDTPHQKPLATIPVQRLY